MKFRERRRESSRFPNSSGGGSGGGEEEEMKGAVAGFFFFFLVRLGFREEYASKRPINGPTLNKMKVGSCSWAQ